MVKHNPRTLDRMLSASFSIIYGESIKKGRQAKIVEDFDCDSGCLSGLAFNSS